VYERLFPKLKSKRALEFFQGFPILDDALDNLPQVRSFLGEKEVALLEEAGCWGEDLYLKTLRLEICLVIQLLLAHRAAIKGVEAKMAELSRADPKLVERLRTVPGMGTNLALTILGHSGNFSRFDSSDAYAAYCGLAPALWQSGQRRVYAKRRRRYSRPLGQAFLQLALTQLRLNPESQAYYERKRREGKPHWIALIALAQRLCKRIYKMMIRSSSHGRHLT